MNLLKMPSGFHGCLVYSAAMLLATSPETLMQEIGHRGHKVFWPQFSPPQCYNGHHIQEIIDCCVRRGKGLMPVDMFPCSAPAGRGELVKDAYRKKDAETRMAKLLERSTGILISSTHACAWDGKQVFDPNGMNYSIEQFELSQYWVLCSNERVSLL